MAFGKKLSENIVEKAKTADNQHFLLFLQCFHGLTPPESVKICDYAVKS